MFSDASGGYIAKEAWKSMLGEIYGVGKVKLQTKWTS
jgi:hypothetical protein